MKAKIVYRSGAASVCRKEGFPLAMHTVLLNTVCRSWHAVMQDFKPADDLQRTLCTSRQFHAQAESGTHRRERLRKPANARIETAQSCAHLSVVVRAK